MDLIGLQERFKAKSVQEYSALLTMTVREVLSVDAALSCIPHYASEVIAC